MIWDIINSFARLAVTLLAVYKLTQFTGLMIGVERVGLGLLASGSLMTVPIIWQGQRSPFDGWAVSIMTIGLLVFLIGRTWRDRRHQRANDAQVDYWNRVQAQRLGDQPKP